MNGWQGNNGGGGLWLMLSCGTKCELAGASLLMLQMPDTLKKCYKCNARQVKNVTNATYMTKILLLGMVLSISLL